MLNTHRLAALVLTFLLAANPCHAASAYIVESSEKSPQASVQVQSLLTIGTGAAQADTVLANKHVLIAIEVRKLLKASGLPVFAIGIKEGEREVSKVVAEGIAKYGVSHTLNITIPSGTVLVRRSTGETVSAKGYEVKTLLSDGKTGAVVWTHTAQVESGWLLGASNVDVAQAIVARMRSDGLF